MASTYTGFLYAASKDIAALEALVDDGIEKHCEIVAFLAQQAAEKMVKSVYTKNGMVPNKTHSVDELLAGAIEQGWLVADETAIDAATNVSMHAVAARYTQMPDINKGEALQAIMNCNVIAAMLENNGYDNIQVNVAAYPLKKDEQSS